MLAFRSYFWAWLLRKQRTSGEIGLRTFVICCKTMF
jgi:hypothetical protein